MKKSLGVGLLLLLVTASTSRAQRSFPSTVSRIRVLNDQLTPSSMTEAQIRFAAMHYVGTQKVRRSEARQFRTYNPGFLVLHYRLGQALGHSYPSGCAPTGTMIQIVHGDSWVQEWPGDPSVVESWFFHQGGQRVFSCSNGHYLADLDSATWRAWWSAQVIAELTDNENDGIFADSYSVPNYFGGCDWSPCLPDVDPTFEAAWAAREHAFSDYMQTALASGGWKWLPNLGAMITSRDPSDWGNVDGAMIEGFAEWGGGGYFDPSDWVLQMNRILPLAAAGKILIAQAYPNETDVAERMFVLGSYLLVKGSRFYVNLDTGIDPEWFPEYAIFLGRPIDALPATIAAFFDATRNVYTRRFLHGRVYVNPGATSRTFDLGGSFDRVTPVGGGAVPGTGIAPGSLSFTTVTALTLGAHQAAIVLDDAGLLLADDFETGDLANWGAP